MSGSDSTGRPRVRTVLWRGLQRRCPHCGRASMFRTWFLLHERCAACGYRFEQGPGDTWGFWILGDRVFIALLLLVIFLGFRSTHWTLAAFLFVVTLVPLIFTMPHRLGFCLGLDYLSRVYLGSSEELPPVPPPGAEPGSGAGRVAESPGRAGAAETPDGV